MGNAVSAASSVFDCAVNPLTALAPEEDDDFEPAPGAAVTPGGALVLERAAPLRASSLWRLNRAFYAALGPRAWTEGIVPHFVSSNAFTARGVARVVMGVLRDVAAAEARVGAARGAPAPAAPAAPAAPRQPVYIIEVGAGHGKLGYLVVEALLRFRPFFPPGLMAGAAGAAGGDGGVGAGGGAGAGGAPPPAPLPFKYVITDPSPSALAAVRAHPGLQDWLAAGVVDTAVYDVEGEGGPLGASLTLDGSGEVVFPGSLERPPVILAAYVLDSLRADALRFTPEGVEQGRVELATPRAADAATGALSHDMLARLRLRWSYEPVRLAGEDELEGGEGEEEGEEGEPARAGEADAAGGEGEGDGDGHRGGEGEGAGEGGGGDAGAAGESAGGADGHGGGGAGGPSGAEPGASAAAGAGAPAAAAPGAPAAPRARRRARAPASLFASEPYASSPALRSLVRLYAGTRELAAARSTVLIPLGGAALLESAVRLAGGRAVLVFGDKGAARVADLLGPPPPPQPALPPGRAPHAPGAGDPPLALHGSFSLPVNFHALRFLAGAAGAAAVGTPHGEGYKVLALLVGAPGAPPAVPSPPPPPALRGLPRPGAAPPGPPPPPAVARALPPPPGAPASPAARTAALVAHLRALHAPAPRDGGAPPPPADLPFLPGHAGVRPPLYAARLPPHAAPGGAGAGSGAPGAGGGFDVALDELALDGDGGGGGPRAAAVAAAWPATAAALHATLHGGLSPEDFSALQRGVKEETPAPGPSLRGALALLRLACHDAEVFLKLRSVIIDQSALGAGAGGGVDAGLGADVRADVARVYAAHYPLDRSGAKDVCFDLGRVLMGQREHATALRLFAASAALCGPHHVTWHNMGVCYYHAGDARAALRAFDESLALRGEYAEARAWRDKVAARVAAEDAADAAAAAAAAATAAAATAAATSDGADGTAEPLV